jgi:uncharacterized protein (DUF1499 family)
MSDSNSPVTSNSPAAGKALIVFAYAALATGLGLGAYALAAPLGVWIGLWEFGTGFNMLRFVNASADWAAWITLAVTIGIFFGARKLAPIAVKRLTTLAAIGCVASALAYVVPVTYQAPEGTPAIHDITTDTDNPPAFVAVAPLRANAPNSVIYGDQPNWDATRMAAAQKEAYPDIVPQTFAESKEEVFNRVLAAVDTLGWELVDQNLAEGRVEATDTTFWFRFKDDVIVLISETPEGTVLQARSKSRVGRSDVGKNASRLRVLFAELR